MGARILIAGGGTGGHLYPALNLAAAFRDLDPEVEPMFLGGRRGLEARVLPGSGYAFRLVDMQPLHRARPWRNWRLLAAAPGVAAAVRRAFRDFEPHLTVGTGCYVSAPALAVARMNGVPKALQEQNAEPGLVTRIFSPHAEQIHLGYPEAEARLWVRPGTLVRALGNPVAHAGRGADFDWPEGCNLLVFGGSQGALGLNRAFLSDLEWSGREPWPDGVSVVWVAGPAHAGPLAERVARLPCAERVRVVPFIDDLGRNLGGASLALCRAGAMSVAELCAAGCPAVLVPLPTSAAGHQLKNARALAQAGAVEVREEGELARGELWSLCRKILADGARRRRMAAAAARRGRPDAAAAIAREMLTLCEA